MPQAEVHPSGAAYATWWSRAGAEIIDGLLIGVPTGVLASLFGAGVVGWTILQAIAAFAYNAVLDGSESGQTLGKALLRIRTRDDDTGGPIGSGRGAGRAAVPFVIGFANRVSPLLGIASLLNYLWPLWDGRNQTWHDKAIGSVVLRVTPVDAS